ncbi:hypothetical protein MFLAVUS_008277 [Mucor flavus]|uniref:C2H2-type domain-containing protein n=1 Tax=Mucor flavus TaxID=439312 RepID=A0ABP9Z6N8_9FUNG
MSRMNLQQFTNDINKINAFTQQAIPSPPCSIPDQPYHLTSTQGLFDNNALLTQEMFLLNDTTHHMMKPYEAEKLAVIDPKQFDTMSREQLIARLVALEKEKHCITDDDENTTEDEQEPIRTCLWVNCGQKFDILQKLISHITEVHVGGGKATYRCEWQKCARINKPFTKRHKMYNHLRTHTGERPFACPKPDCEKKFSRPDSLTTHIKTHSNVRPFVCLFPDCGKAYYHSRSLKKHEKIHETVVPVQSVPSAPAPPSYEQVMSTPGQVPFVDPFYSQFNHQVNYTFAQSLNNTYPINQNYMAPHPPSM